MIIKFYLKFTKGSINKKIIIITYGIVRLGFLRE